MSNPFPPEFQSLISHLRIAHQLPGRVRLKLDVELDASLLALVPGFRRLGAVLEGIAAVRSVKPNLLARSCTIEYDPERLSDAAWADFLAGRQSAGAQSLRELIMQMLKEISRA